MFKIAKKTLARLAVIFAVIFCLALIIPPARFIVMPVLKVPLYLFNGLRRNAAAILFFYRNRDRAERLQARIDFLLKTASDRKELELENQRLRRLLGFKQKAGYRVIPAIVIGRDPSNWSSTVIIDRGSSSGVQKGFVCVTFLGLVGRVIETTRTTSTVMLVNDPNVSVSAVVQRSRQEGLVSGSLGGTLLMKYLPRDCDIKVSDAVVTSGLTRVFPKGIPVGTVVTVREESSGLSRYAVIKPAVELSALEEVLVVIP
ncbi:MAG: rod shape-determining protein MreC [Candidatus Omnitrophica bacterium]|nr:rod shape-determining protein MreC [Candidatus Omnitrophota bacterium]